LNQYLDKYVALFTLLFFIQATWCIQENTYDICRKLLGWYPVPTPSHVMFSVKPSAAATAKAMNKKLILPDPVLITICAVCACITNLSGTAEQANQILRDLEDITVLADDGSMAELLSSCLTYWALELGTGFSIEMRMATKNVLLGTGFGMEIRMPTKNI
jgi:hypothetical protein